MSWFGEKGMPSSGMGWKSYFSISLDDFRKISHPISFGNPSSVILATIGGMSPLIQNLVMKRPMQTGGPSMILGVAVGVWVGYYINRSYHQHYLGKFKYCVDYAFSRKEMFPLKTKPKFSDPEVLDHFLPAGRRRWL